MIVHCPSKGAGPVGGNLASTFVELVINLGFGIVGFDESEGLFEVYGSIDGLPWVINPPSELILIWIVTEGPHICVMYFYFRIFMVHRSFPRVSLLSIGLLGRRMRLLDALIETIVFRVGFLCNFHE